MVQEAVNQLCRIVPVLTDHLEPEQLEAAGRLLDALVHPLSAEDVAMLVGLLPAEGDTAFGLSWSVVHAIEASPDWPLWDMLQNRDSEWVRILLLRLANDGRHPR